MNCAKRVKVREAAGMQRDNAIDAMKGLLTLLMILAHVIQFFLSSHKITDFISNYVNLTTFSGFMFCFGYVCYLAYIRKGVRRSRILLGSVKALSAYLISGAGFCVLVAEDPGRILRMLTFSDMPGYSEFLLSFTLLYMLVFLFLPQLKIVMESGILTFLGVGASLGFTLLPYQDVDNTLLGSLIGSTEFCTFPVLAYAAFFLLGGWLANHRGSAGSMAFLLISWMGTGCFLLYILRSGQMPLRFPPSIWWILGGAGIVAIYDFLVRKIQVCVLFPFLAFVGEKTLFFLVVSNLTIFLARRIMDVFHLQAWNRWFCMGTYIVALLIPIFILRLGEHGKKKEK